MKIITTITHYANCLIVVFILSALIVDTKGIGYYLYLGIFQLTITFIISMAYAFSEKLGKYIGLYWLFVVLYFFTQYILSQFLNRELGQYFFSIVPMLIAIYNCYLTYKVMKS